MRKIGTENLGDTITAHMHTDMITLRKSQTAADALSKFRQVDITDKIIYLYVVDDHDRLAGVVPMRRLLGSNPEERIESLMVWPVITVSDSGSVLEACEKLLDHRFLALPIVDSENRLKGVIDLSQFTDDVLTTAQKQMDSAFQLIGVHIARARRVSSWQSFRQRFPWLMANMTSGIVCAFVASRFELLLSEVVILPMIS